MDVVNYKKIQDAKKDQAISVYLQAVTEASQNWALSAAFSGKVGLMIQHALGDDGSAVTWSGITTWADLQNNATAWALFVADTDIYGMFALYRPEQIYGIALVSSGGGAGTWQRIDKDGNNITLIEADFDAHDTWGGIAAETIDSQSMIKIPKFWVKYGLGPVGSDQAGNLCQWVSSVPRGGFVVHPGFMSAGSAIDQFYVGAYECSDGGSSKAASVTGAAPLVSIDFPTMQTRCTNRNTGGVTGFQMIDIYQLSAIQLLCLIEEGSPDVQSTIGAGNTSTFAAVNTGASNAVWRGIYELWGNVLEMVDGLQLDGSHQVKIWDKNGNQTLQSTGVTTGSTDGWITAMHDDSDTAWDLNLVFLPETVDATEGNGTFGDYVYASDGGEVNVCYHGGLWSRASEAGLFFLNLHDVSSTSAAYIGSRLAKV